MTSGFAEALDACARDLLREREELVARIQADLDRVDAIDIIVRGYRAVEPNTATGCADGGTVVRLGSGLIAVGG